MGRGNYCPTGKLTDQWYVDYDKYRYCEDDEGNECWGDVDYEQCDIDVHDAISEIQQRFPSFEECDDYPHSSHGSYWGEHVWLRNKFFEIGTADNTWSEAIFIHERDDLEYPGLAAKNIENYRKGIRDVLLDFFGDICVRCGPWMSGKLTKETVNEPAVSV